MCVRVVQVYAKSPPGISQPKIWYLNWNSLCASYFFFFWQARHRPDGTIERYAPSSSALQRASSTRFTCSMLHTYVYMLACTWQHHHQPHDDDSTAFVRYTKSQSTHIVSLSLCIVYYVWWTLWKSTCARTSCDDDVVVVVHDDDDDVMRKWSMLWSHADTDMLF